MRCNTKQSIYYSASSLYMCRVSTTPIISTQNCNYSLRYRAAISLQPGQAGLATLEGGSCTKNMTSTGGCSYIFVYSWWWVWLTPETCGVNLQNNRLLCVASRWTIINITLSQSSPLHILTTVVIFHPFRTGFVYYTSKYAEVTEMTFKP